MKLLFIVASTVRRVYWFIFRPKTEGVKCLIECNDEYLLVVHSYGSRRHDWNLPGGGVKKNENVCDAVKREVFEELGISLSKVTEVKKYVSSAEYKVDTIYCFYSKINSSDFKINKNELSEAKWFPKNNLPGNLSRSIKESLAFLPD